MAGKPESRYEMVLAEIDPVIRLIIKSKLHVTLHRDDGRKANQDALEIVGRVHVEVLKKLNTGEEIHDIRGYASVVTYNACAEYLRADGRRDRYRLSNKLRYFLEHNISYGVWEDDRGAMVCGFSGWPAQKLPKADGSRIAVIRADPGFLGPDALPGKQWDRLDAKDLDRLLEPLFQYLGGPLDFNTLVSLVGPIVGVRVEVDAPPPDDPGYQPRPGDDLDTLQMLRWLWIELLALDGRWRAAFLLNPPSGTEIEVFQVNGIASLAEIGAALGLTPEQYAILWKELPLAPTDRNIVIRLTSVVDRFAFLWRWLPLKDSMIGITLGATVQQIINLRRLARDRLAVRLRARLQNPGER